MIRRNPGKILALIVGFCALAGWFTPAAADCAVACDQQYMRSSNTGPKVHNHDLLVGCCTGHDSSTCHLKPALALKVRQSAFSVMPRQDGFRVLDPFFAKTGSSFLARLFSQVVDPSRSDTTATTVPIYLQNLSLLI
ncbi:MAG: hypothetical protein JSU72_07295 [Deltaproteobacteria bacterium]|nr:MAG: hypothetical protein JSU72_07295 [Deltaproteobacteria bacterium]